ncbi:MAG: YlbF family regulator [Lachnospiraceae bacterium]|nr:YlbF family regulator [Lachnospiraceae bacterium]
MNEADVILEELIRVIKDSQEYTQYKTALNEIKKYPEHCARISEYRKKNITLQLSENLDFFAENDKLQNEFDDLAKNAMITEFLRLEHAYCMYVKRISDKLLEESDIDTSFMD